MLCWAFESAAGPFRQGRFRSRPQITMPAAAAAPSATGHGDAEPSRPYTAAKSASGTGASRAAKRKRKKFVFGNYDAYYNYRHKGSVPVDSRLHLLQRSWLEGRSVLDIGCNSGVLTFSLAETFSPRSVLGIDIDGQLIRRAQSRLAALQSSVDSNGGAQQKPTGFPFNLSFRAENFVARKHRRCSRSRQRISHHSSSGPAIEAPVPAAAAAAPARPPGGVASATEPVRTRDASAQGACEHFDVVLCLSVTKWVHLNWGDAGLRTLFQRVFDMLPSDGTGLFILEPQPWKSYKKKCVARSAGVRYALPVYVSLLLSRYCLTETTKANFKSVCMRPNDFTTHLTQNVSRSVGSCCYI
jgi:7SK snRNA methylphosphate capping enzyme